MKELSAINNAIKLVVKLPILRYTKQEGSGYMYFLSVQEVAKKWGISERSVRNYCAEGRVNGAVLVGKTWKIPADAEKPIRLKKGEGKYSPLLQRLKQEQAGRQTGGSTTR